MDSQEILFPPGATWHDWIMDCALAGGMALITVVPYWGFHAYNGVPAVLWLLSGLMMVAPLVFRRHSPLLMLAGCTVAGLTQVAVSDIPTASLLAIPIVSYSVARWIPGPTARSVIAVGLVGSVLGPARWLTGGGSLGLTPGQLLAFALGIFVCLGLCVTPYAVGRRLRESSEAAEQRAVAAEQRYQAIITEREHQARLAESRARATIARELHDVVAHSLSVMIVQAEGGRALAAKRPEAATETLDTIAEIGRDALGEMRRIVGVLRQERDSAAGSAEYAPMPALEDIPELVHRTSSRASLRVNGVPPRVSPVLGLTIYRIVQEALTNFLKHAGPDATAVVTLTYAQHGITAEVVDDGRARPSSRPANSGHGLRGMHERVTSMGGRLTAGPRPRGGFEVRAMIPFIRVTPPPPGGRTPALRPAPMRPAQGQPRSVSSRGDGQAAGPPPTVRPEGAH